MGEWVSECVAVSLTGEVTQDASHRLQVEWAVGMLTRLQDVLMFAIQDVSVHLVMWIVVSGKKRKKLVLAASFGTGGVS